MRVKTVRAFSKALGGYVFLLVLLLKGAFPNAAFAFLSSVDACAVKPECAAAISSELAPVIATPTAAAGGPISITATSATGATTSANAVAAVTVVGDIRLSGVVAFHLWNQAKNGQAQNKAAERYCAIYPADSVCNPSVGYWHLRGYVIGGYCTLSTTYREIDVTNYPTIFATTHYGCAAESITNVGRRLAGDWSPMFPGSITAVRINGTIKPWKDWPQEKRSAAVASLTNSDWTGFITSMPEGGRLTPGDKVNAPIIVIPGQEADDPSTPSDERLLKKQPGFFTNPGRDDFDYDADGTADSADPEPQNPSVPTASGGSSSPPSGEPLDTSQEPEPSPLSEIPEGANAKSLAETKAAELRATLPRKDWPSANAAVVDTETGTVYHNTSGKPLPTTIHPYLAERMPVPSLEDWEVANCAEFKAVNDALLNGARIEKLEVHTVRTKKGEAYPRCKNCRLTVDGPTVTSDP